MRLFDDTQVQSLGLSWLDTHDESYFTVDARSSPDDFIMKPVEFYEMPNGLWFPHSNTLWNDGNPMAAGELNHYRDLTISEVMSGANKQLRHKLRTAGNNRLQAYQTSRRISSNKRGYHRSRIEGFVQHPRGEWQARRQEWLATAEGQKAKTSIEGIRGTFDNMVKALCAQQAAGASGSPTLSFE